MTRERQTLRFPDDARAVVREPETDEEIVRRQPVRGMIRRMMRNKGIILVEIEPTATPFEAMVVWASELSAKPTPADLADLAERLRGSSAIEEDGALAGQRIVDAITKQAGLIRAWPQRARLNTLVGQLHGLLCELGML